VFQQFDYVARKPCSLAVAVVGNTGLEEHTLSKKRPNRKSTPPQSPKIRRDPVSSRSQESLLLPDDPSKDFLTPEEWLSVGMAFDLSSRELCVAILIFEGLTRSSIARTLHRADGKAISSGTVRVYIDRLFDKLRVKDRVGFVLRILRVHLAISAQDD